MSATERARKLAEGHDKRRIAAEKEGMRRVLADSDGRALLFWILDTATKAEGDGSSQLRSLGWDILNVALMASREGVQAMREEWEKPRGTRAEAEDEEGEE